MSKSLTKLKDYNTDFSLDLFTKGLNPDQQDNYFYVYNNFSNNKFKSSSCKNRSLITASKAKPYKQKGTGRARRGSKKSPLLVGGGVVFGPQPRLPKFSLNNKFFSVLNRYILNFLSDKTYVVDFESKDLKISSFFKSFPDLRNKKVSFITDNSDINLVRTIGNVSSFHFFSSHTLKLPVLFSSEYVVFTPNSLKQFSSEVK